jgi:hypothetical protein
MTESVIAGANATLSGYRTRKSSPSDDPLPPLHPLSPILFLFYTGKLDARLEIIELVVHGWSSSLEEQWKIRIRCRQRNIRHITVK